MRHRSETASADQTALHHVTALHHEMETGVRKGLRVMGTDVLKMLHATAAVASREHQETAIAAPMRLLAKGTDVPMQHRVKEIGVPWPDVLRLEPIENAKSQIGPANRTNHGKRTKGNNNLQSDGCFDHDAL
jgi:hypothetical protein